MKIWIATIGSDSGDDYPPLAFYNKPERAELVPLLAKHTGEDPGPPDRKDLSYPCNYGYLHVELHEVEVK